MAALIADQRRDRERHYALRRLLREIVRGIFGRRSVLGKLLNEAADALFESRMQVLAIAHRRARQSLSSDFAALRLPLPTWSAFQRAAQRAHAQVIAEQDLRAEAEAAWLLKIRTRRDRLKQGPEAGLRLARARAAIAERLEQLHGQVIETMLRERSVDHAAVLADMHGAGLSAAERRRLPALIESVRGRLLLRDQLWLAGVRARRDRLQGSTQTLARLERAPMAGTACR